MRKILIAAGSETTTDELALMFQGKYEVHTCIRGDDALRLLQDLKPDILIINLSLSHITGLSVLQQTAYTPQIIIALTNYLSDVVVQDAQAAGVDALIRLPCSADYVISHLNAFLQAGVKTGYQERGKNPTGDVK